MIILYDDDCGFCRWTVAWALQRDTHHLLDSVAIQSDKAAEMLADLAPAQQLRSMHILHDDARRESGGAALRAVLAALPSTRLASRIASVLPQATDVIYAFVAGHRHQVGRFVSASARQRADAVLTEARPGQRPLMSRSTDSCGTASRRAPRG